MVRVRAKVRVRVRARPPLLRPSRPGLVRLLPVDLVHAPVAGLGLRRHDQLEALLARRALRLLRRHRGVTLRRLRRLAWGRRLCCRRLCCHRLDCRRLGCRLGLSLLLGSLGMRRRLHVRDRPYRP
eukprot:scaffold17707_cov57-Phaeocystis_antarctica.AAC.2